MSPEELRATFFEHGYAVAEGFVSAAWCDRLKHRIAQLVDAFDADAVRSVFSTNEQTRTSDAYFLESGDAVRFFFEEEAVGDDGALTVPKERAINKIGHALHRHDEVFRSFGDEHGLLPLGSALGCEDPLAIQSMAILKPPGIGGEVGWHQDATFLQTDPPSVVGLWVALDDARRDNGCLWVIPGGHEGPLRSRFERVDGETTRFVSLSEEPFETQRAVALEVPKGTLVALHGLLPHRSDANRSPLWRHAYSVHVIGRHCRYPATNWLQSPATAGMPS